jgi:hypothetical protein
VAIKPTSTLIGNVVVDAVTRLVPRNKKVVTKHKIETGAIISEHIADDECYLVMDVVCGDEELISIGGIPGFPTSAVEKRRALYAIRDAKMPIPIETPIDSYQGYALTDIDEEITVKNSLGFAATLTFEKIDVAAIFLQTLPLMKVLKKTGDKLRAGMKQTPETDTGVQSAQEIEDARAEQEAAEVVGALFAGLG